MTAETIPGTTQAATRCVDGLGTQACYQSVADLTDGYFTAHIGPLFLLGCAVFSVLWGAIAGLLVKKIDMTNHKGVETCIQKFGNNDEEYYKRNPNETRQKGVEEVMSLMTRVGAMITEGA